MKEIYLDNSATTAVCDKAIEKATLMMTSKYGNPSSLHSKGLEAELEIEDAREIIAKSIHADSKDIYFTSGSTESNNTVLFGVANKQRKNGNKIIVSCIEHSSVYEAAQELSKTFDVVFLDVDRNGIISFDQLEKEVDEKTILVSIMSVNNEIGAIEDIERISKIVRKKNKDTLIHCDATQAYGKIDINVSKWDVDFLNFSSHKVHGPKNVGALYIKNKSKLTPLLFGGEQQKKVRVGTECSSLIPAFGAAVSEFSISKNREHVKELNNYLCESLKDINEVSFNSNPDSLEYIVNISIKGIRSETMLHFLESKNIFVSSGSACAKGKKSYVLEAIAIDSDLIDSAIRISFSKYNTKEDIDLLVDAIKEAIERLSKK